MNIISMNSNDFEDEKYDKLISLLKNKNILSGENYEI